MTKIGVGVGEEFPIEDNLGAASGQGAAGQDSGGDGREEAGCGWSRDEACGDWRQRRDEWRARRHEWRARRRAWRRRMRDDMHEGWRDHGFGFLADLPPVLRVILFVAAVALVVRVAFHAPIIILALVIGAVLYHAHRRQRYADYYDVPPPRPEG